MIFLNKDEKEAKALSRWYSQNEDDLSNFKHFTVTRELKAQ